MAALPYTTHLRPLLSPQVDPQVQEQALNLLRNLVHGQPSDISAALDYSSQDILLVLETNLTSAAFPPPTHSLPSSAEGVSEGGVGGDTGGNTGGEGMVVEVGCSTSRADAQTGPIASESTLHTLYIISNIATGVEEHKNALMNTSIPTSLVAFLNPAVSEQMRVAALWCVINLSWPGENSSPSTPPSTSLDAVSKAKSSGGEPTPGDRLERFTQCQVLPALQLMKDDPCLDVAERVRTALANFCNAPCFDKSSQPDVQNDIDMQM